MFSRLLKNEIDQEIHNDMIKSFKKSIKKKQTDSLKLRFEEEIEPSMEPAIKYLELQSKLLQISKPSPIPYPYDYDK